MARNRIGVDVVAVDGDAGQGVTMEGDDPPLRETAETLEAKRQKKQKELLRKKKAERRAHAKQRKKQGQLDQEPAQEEPTEVHESSETEIKAVPHTEIIGNEETTLKRSPLPILDVQNPGVESVQTQETVPEESTSVVESVVSPLVDQQLHIRPEDESVQYEIVSEIQEPSDHATPIKVQDVPTCNSPSQETISLPAEQHHSGISVPSEAVTLSATEVESTPYEVPLRRKKTKTSHGHNVDDQAAAKTIQKALKRNLLKSTKQTLVKAKSYIRHSSKVLVDDSPPVNVTPLPINTTPSVIIPPLKLKPRTPLPSSSASSDGEECHSSSESSPTHTLSRPSSTSSCSTCSSRSSSSSSPSPRHHKKRHRPQVMSGPTIDMLLPHMPTNDERPVLRQYTELHHYMATRIQAHVRGMRGRLLAREREVELETEIRAEALRELEEEASVRIQAHIKGYLERRRHPSSSRHVGKSRHVHKYPRTKSNSVMPQCLIDSIQRPDGEIGNVAEWPDEFDLESMDTWDELNNKATTAGELVTTAHFLSRGKLRVFCGTWNLHAKKPTEDLRLWIRVNKYHIVAVGTEECVHSIAKSVVFTSKKQWEDQLKETLGDEYVLVAAHSLTAIHNVVFVHESVLPYIHNIQSDAVATGLGNQLGNKGGVGIAFCVAHTSFAFINCHFDAHQNNVAKRNANFHRINQELKLVAAPTTGSPLLGVSSPGLGKTTTSRFSSASIGSSASILNPGTAALRVGSSSSFRRPKRAISESFDRVFWYGDLNYRINGTRRMIDLLLLHNQHAVLRFNDQLRIEMHKGTVFTHFAEGPLHFRPTYKFDKHSNVYDSGPKQRIPSWTDRILYLSNDKPHDIELLSYRSHMNFQSSDHRPVGAVFQVLFTRGGETMSPPAEVKEGGGPAVGGEEIQAFARVLAKGYKPTQSRSEVCVVQ